MRTTQPRAAGQDFGVVRRRRGVAAGRAGLALIAAAAAWTVAAAPARAQIEQQSVVDRATLTVQDILTDINNKDIRSLLQKARAVMVCPQVFKAGFIFAGAGGDCLLVARDGAGSWSDPAFYGIGSGSFGLQIGLQSAELMMMIMSQKALDAVMDNQFKLGADASIAVATMGAGVQGATTAALRADIVVYALTSGAFAGISVEGSLMNARTGWNEKYYGRPYAARQIVMEMQANNPGADPLRAMLTRYGAPGELATASTAPTTAPEVATSPAPAYAAPGPAAAPSYAAPAGSSAGPTSLAPIQQQNLPPPGR